MRPVNLIPPEERRGEKAPLRTGPLAYVIIAVLALALVAVTLVVMTDNQISDRKAEKASLASQVSQAQAEAKRYRDFTSFASLQQVRQETVSNLAASRFDWERVLRELAIVIPSDVWLTDLTASASAESASASSGTTSSGASGIESIEGPSLDIQGCAVGHESVARFLAALRDIDGVTRASVLSSDRPDTPGSTSGSSGTGGSGEGDAGISCPTKDFISTFEVVVAFDDAQPASSDAPPPGSTPVGTAPTSTTAGANSDQSQVSGAQDQLQQQSDSAAQTTEKGHKAVDTFIPGTGSTR